MKQVKLNGVTMDAEEAKKIIADLQAQIDAPEEPEFWEGQLVEMSDIDDWYLKVFDRYISCSSFPYRNTRGGSYRHCRPLQDPLILQFKPHNPGDQMPCDGGLRVMIMRRDGGVSRGTARMMYWSESGDSSIIGWMPADGWGS